MTAEQREQNIIEMISHLPVFQQVRIALAILKEVNPDQIAIKQTYQDPSMTPELASAFDKRLEEMIKGEVDEISGEDFLAELRSLRS